MCILSNFGERLKELMQEREINAPELANQLGTDRTNITRYLRGERAPLYGNFIKMLNYFQCSADYLLGLKEYPAHGDFCVDLPVFGERLREVMGACGFTQYKLVKTGKISRAELFGWLSDRKLPGIESLAKLAAIMGCSVDYLLGRV